MTNDTTASLSPTISSYNDVHPLTPTPAMTISNTNSTANSPAGSLPSSPPLSSQQQQQQQDDVTTIFVVGFPDDMQEREFQNMFVFAKGFEAASLKWHCKDQQDDQDFYSMLNSLSKKQMVSEGFASTDEQTLTPCCPSDWFCKIQHSTRSHGCCDGNER